MSLEEQLSNVGSEVGRAMKWKGQNEARSRQAALRAIELLDLTIQDSKNKDRLKEVTRCKELWLDFFWGENIYNQTATQWDNYFLHLTQFARKF